MCGAGPRASCRGMFRRRETLPVLCQHIMYPMLCIIDNPNNFHTVSEVNKLHTRSKKSTFHSKYKPHKCSKRNYLLRN